MFFFKNTKSPPVSGGFLLIFTKLSGKPLQDLHAQQTDKKPLMTVPARSSTGRYANTAAFSSTSAATISCPML